jgi:hypothetical protein
MDTIILTFKDQQYPLAKVANKGKSGQPITVALKDLDSSYDAMALVKLSAESKEFQDGSIILYKHEGKYIVFGGQERALTQIAKGATEISGHLLTSYMLKGMRIEKPIAESAKVEAVEQLANKFNSSPRPNNRPYDNKTPRTGYGNNSRTYPRQASGTLHARSGGTRSGS